MKKDNRARSINLESDVPLALPSQQAEERLALRWVDWHRIRRLVESAAKPPPAASTWPATFLGIGITTALTLIPLTQSTPRPESWVIPTFIVTTVASFALAAYAQWAWHVMSRARKDDVASICADMAEIESAYEAEAEREALRPDSRPQPPVRTPLRPLAREVSEILREEPLTVSEVASRLNIPMTAAAGVVGGLFNLGLVERRPPKDGKSTWILKDSASTEDAGDDPR